MKKFKVVIISGLIMAVSLTVFLRGITAPNPVVKMENWNDVISVTEDMMFRADSSSLIKHTDATGVPNEILKKIKINLQKWKGVPKTMKFDRVDIVDFEEFKKQEAQYGPIPGFFSPRKWNINPEKVITYRFSGDDGTKLTWSFGAFQKQEAWYFSCGY